MKQNAETEFELDEPAARTHTPAGWPIQVIEITPSGKAPKKYGPSVYRFYAAMTLSVILPRRGWILVKKTKNYAYLIPPRNEKPPFQISIAIPTPEYCLELARRCYRRGVSWFGQLGEWPASYYHNQNTDVREMWRDPSTREMVSRLHKNPPKSGLSIGEWGAWNTDVTGEGGEFALGLLPPSVKPYVHPPLIINKPAFLEGATTTVELTKYERNAAARRQCLEHFGPICQACGLSYEDTYGSIAAELIHVHHIKPLASIGAEYQVDPIRDLVPLCANCHHVVHQRIPPYSVEEIRHAIQAQLIRNGVRPR